MNEFNLAWSFNIKRLFDSIFGAAGILLGVSALLGALVLIESYNREMQDLLEQPPALILRVDPRRLRMASTTALEPFEENLPRFQFTSTDVNAILLENLYITASFEYTRRMYSISESFTQEGFMPPDIGMGNMGAGQQQNNILSALLISRVFVFEVTASFFKACVLKPIEGFLFSDENVTQGNRVAVAGKFIAVQLFSNGIVLNKTIKLNGIDYTIIGIVDDIYGERFGNNDFSMSLFIPQPQSANQRFQAQRTLQFTVKKARIYQKQKVFLLAILKGSMDRIL